MKPRALDLFCGAGGVSKGLADAGFEVWGVDIEPQPRYVHPGRFVQGDALNPPFDLSDFDLVWASPVCKGYTCASVYLRQRGKEYPDQIAATRAMLEDGARAWVIENVPGAPIRADVVLDGTMFPGLKVIRRRHFETSFPVGFRLGFDARGHIAHHGWSTVVGRGRCSGTPKEANAWHTIEAVRAAMGIDWMSRDELSQAIPPAYAEYIGRAFLQSWRAAA